MNADPLPWTVKQMKQQATGVTRFLIFFSFNFLLLFTIYVLYVALCLLLWSCCSGCCRLSRCLLLLLLLPLLLAAAPFCCCWCCCSGLPSCSFCCWLLYSSYFTARAAPSRSAAAADLEQDNICITVLPSPGLKLATTPLTLAKQQLPLLSRTCLSRPGQDSVWRHLEHSVEANPQAAYIPIDLVHQLQCYSPLLQIFDLYFFHYSNLSGSLTHKLNYFQIRFRFLWDIRIFKKLCGVNDTTESELQ